MMLWLSACLWWGGLVVLLSVESVIGLPLFFLLLSLQKIQHFSLVKKICSGVILGAVMSHFYVLPVAFWVVALLMFQAIELRLREQKRLYRIFLIVGFCLLQTFVFVLARLHFQAIMILHIGVFLFYLYKKYFWQYGK